MREWIVRVCVSGALFTGLGCSGGVAEVAAGASEVADETAVDTAAGRTDTRGRGATDVRHDEETPGPGDPDAAEIPTGSGRSAAGLVSAAATMRSSKHRLAFTLGAPPARPAAGSGRTLGTGLSRSIGGTP